MNAWVWVGPDGLTVETAGFWLNVTWPVIVIVAGVWSLWRIVSHYYPRPVRQLLGSVFVEQTPATQEVTA